MTRQLSTSTVRHGLATETTLPERFCVFEAGLDKSPLGHAVLDRDQRFGYANAAFAALVGCPLDELVGGTLASLVAADADDWRGVAGLAAIWSGERESDRAECRYLRPDGSVVWVSTTAVPLTDGAGEPLAVFIQASDITDRKVAETQLVHRATHDQLTGLPYRGVFLEQLRHALARLRRHADTNVVVLFLDLDGLKSLNDTHGHAVGDELLRSIGPRLRRALRPSDVIARLGGDEFTVLIEDLDDTAEATQIATRILAELEVPFALSIGPVMATASVGIAVCDDAAMEPDTLIANADDAMYRAKQRGGGCFEVFNESGSDPLAQRRRVEADLREALRSARFELAYQPIIDLTTGRVNAVEALLRWRHPTLGLLPAAEFIEVAERSGLIVPIGKWVLAEALSQLAEWDDRLGELSPERLFVNVGVRELSPDFAAAVAAVLDGTGIAHRRLCLEVTETEILADPESARTAVLALSELGCSIVVDDFGTGYSSLSRLTELPVDAVKIDTSFVRDMDGSRESMAIVSAILLLAHNLRLDTIAEGIETADHLRQLTEMGCPHGQGHHISRPLTGEQFIEAASGMVSA